MRYPFVLVYLTPEQQRAGLDGVLARVGAAVEASLYVTSRVETLNMAYSANMHLLLTLGGRRRDAKRLVREHLQGHALNKWVHFKMRDVSAGVGAGEVDVSALNALLNGAYARLCARPREEVRPVFSVFTTAYKSYDKILRVYECLKRQTLADWEWVVLDDSDDAAHWEFLKKNLRADARVRLYCGDGNNGSIGNVKNAAVALCRGKYVLEMDHDDEVFPFVLREAADVMERDAAVGFVYMDFANVFEDSVGREGGGGDGFFCYGDSICKGYGSYYLQRVPAGAEYGMCAGRWVYVYNTPNINNITLSHLVCCPNHPRIWRRDVLQRVGNYCELLPICDDYEVLLRTAVEPGVKMAKISKLAYIQYMTRGGAGSISNFSLIRNREINRIGPMHLQPAFYAGKREGGLDVHAAMEALGAREDESKWINVDVPLWKRGSDNDYKPKYCNLLLKPGTRAQVAFVGIHAAWHWLCADGGTRWTEWVRDHATAEWDLDGGAGELDLIVLDNQCDHGYLMRKMDDWGLGARVACYSLPGVTLEELVRYFHRCYSVAGAGAGSGVATYVLQMTRAYSLPFNTQLGERHEVIAAVAQDWLGAQRGVVLKQTAYLEIGVEYGQTFTRVPFEDKMGVDPDPKLQDERVVRLTSDAFFQQQQQAAATAASSTIPKKRYDVVFIDGMHQVEQVVKDWNHCMANVTHWCLLVLDDVLPRTYREQLKVPVKHRMENGLLKYGEEWTGDVWKFVHVLLRKLTAPASAPSAANSVVAARLFHHVNYRGVACFMVDLTQTLAPQRHLLFDEVADVAEMNALDFDRDFPDYLELWNVGGGGMWV